MDIIQRLYDNQVHHAALLYDAPGPHPDDQACQAKAQNQFGGAAWGSNFRMILIDFEILEILPSDRVFEHLNKID